MCHAIVTAAAIATVHEAPDIELTPRNTDAAAAQARLERGRSRAVGECGQAGQAAAQAASRREAGHRLAGGRIKRRAATGFAEAAGPAADHSRIKTGTAAAGADRTPRALAAFARPQGNRRPGRFARHDAGPRSPRVADVPAARAWRRAD